MVRAIALQVVRDAVRARIFHLLLLGGGGLLFAAPLLHALSMGDRARGLTDLGLTALWLLVMGAAHFVGAQVLGTDLQRGTLGIWLARPVSAVTLAGARLLGAMATVGLLSIGAAGVFVGVAALWGIPLTSALVGWTLLCWAEACIVVALAMLLSTLVSPNAAIFSTAGLWLAGHLLAPYGRLAHDSGDTVLVAAHEVLSVLLPNLSLFDAAASVIGAHPLDVVTLVSTLLYAALWVAAPFCATVVVLNRRDVA